MPSRVQFVLSLLGAVLYAADRTYGQTCGTCSGSMQVNGGLEIIGSNTLSPALNVTNGAFIDSLTVNYFTVNQQVLLQNVSVGTLSSIHSLALDGSFSVGANAFDVSGNAVKSKYNTLDNGAGNMGVAGGMNIAGDVNIGSTDLQLGTGNTGRGSGGRALVADVGNVLGINYNSDFTGGVHVFGSIRTDHNILDDGSGNLVVQGTLTASTLSLNSIAVTSISAIAATMGSSNTGSGIFTTYQNTNNPELQSGLGADGNYYIQSITGSNGDGGTYGVWLPRIGSSWAGLSDRRMKRNIAALPNNTLSEIDLLHPKSYFYKGQIGNNTNRTFYGLIAQELQQVFPEMVETSDKGMLGVRYQDLIPVLIKGVQELHEHNKKLQQQVDVLMRQFAAFTSNHP